MRATITSKGQITIPLRLRQKLHLRSGDQLEFDENSPILTARRAVDVEQWKATVSEWQKSCAEALEGHPWKGQPSTAIVDDLRGGPVQSSEAHL